MKVLYLHHSPNFGGSSKSLALLLEALRLHGISITVACPAGSALTHFEALGFDTIAAPTTPTIMSVVGMQKNSVHALSGLLRSKQSSRWTAKIIDSTQPDIVHLNEWGLLAQARVAHRRGIPVVMHARTALNKKNRILNWICRRAINRYVDHTVCITGSVMTSLRPSGPASVIYNPLEPIDQPQSSELPVESGRTHFLSLSALQKTKGVFDIVEAAIRVRDRDDIGIRIAGKVPQPAVAGPAPIKIRLMQMFGIVGKGNEAIELLDIVERNALTNVDFIGHIDDVGTEILACDVMLAPMHLNAPPRSVYEAARHGRPSILAMEDKVEDVVEDQVSGLLIDECSPDQLAAAMLQLADSPDLLRKLGETARERSILRHDPAQIALQVIETYKRISRSDSSEKNDVDVA